MVFDFGWNRGTSTSLDVLLQCIGGSPGGTHGAMLSELNDQLARAPLTPLLHHMSAAGIRILQQSLGIEADGIAGPETIHGLEARQDLRASATILGLGAAQVLSYKKLANFSVYGAGWLARSARRQAAALAAVQPIRRPAPSGT